MAPAKNSCGKKKGCSAINSRDLRLHHQYSQHIHAVGFQKHDPRTLRKIQKFVMKEMGTPEVCIDHAQ